MSYQRPSLVNTSMAGPSSASYSEFLKDIYASLRALTNGLTTINTRIDELSQQLQSFESKLELQAQMSQYLGTRIDTLIQQTENTQIRQTNSGLSLLSELDTLGTRQVEPSTVLAELGIHSLKPLATQMSKLSFHLNDNTRCPEIPIKLEIPNIIIHEPETAQPNCGENQEHAAIAELTDVPGNQQLGSNFLILE